jgi:hypothetical protein
LVSFDPNNCLNRRKFQKIVGDTDHNIVVHHANHIVHLGEAVSSFLDFDRSMLDHSVVHLIDYMILNFVDMSLSYHIVNKIINYHVVNKISYFLNSIGKNSNCTKLNSYRHLEQHSQTCMVELLRDEAHPTQSSVYFIPSYHGALHQHLLASFEPGTQKGQLLCLLLLLGCNHSRRIVGPCTQNSLCFPNYVMELLHCSDGKFHRSLSCRWTDGTSHHSLSYCLDGKFLHSLLQIIYSGCNSFQLLFD